jgi:hypothetical protein
MDLIIGFFGGLIIAYIILKSKPLNIKEFLK